MIVIVVVNTVKKDIEKLKSEDVIVVWGGSNDIGKTNSKEALRHVCNFVKNNQTVNIMVMAAPPTPLHSDMISFRLPVLTMRWSVLIDV